MKHQYRIPVMYTCCEEGRVWAYKYTRAENIEQVKIEFRNYFFDCDIEEWPDFCGIEVYDEEMEEWV